MVDVLNPEHTESKPLNTTELETNPTANAAPEADAHASNHNLSASAESQTAENETAENQPAESQTAENHATAPEHVEVPPALEEADKRPVTPAVLVASEDSPHQREEEMDFGAMLESFEHEQAAQEAAQAVDGNVITGIVIKLTDKHVVVDVGLKSEGLIPLEQVLDHNGQPKLQPGQTIEVVVEREEAEGGILLSYDKALRHRVWDTIEKAATDKTPVSGIVVSRVKGGLTVDIGIKAFLPGSQVEIRPVRNLESYVGQTLEVRVIKLNKKRGNVVVSRKELLEEEVTVKRTLTLDHLEEGTILTGTVKNLTEYGAFVDLGGIDGLLHVTDMSWGRLTHPRDLVNVGDEIQVKVLKFDKEKQRISLGFKQLTPDPWLDVAERYPIGARVRGRVLSVTDYGAFVELEQGIEGLVHVSEMTWSKRMKHPTKLVKPADEIETIILQVNPADRRISLGMKQLLENPWEHLSERYTAGTIVEGRVRNLTEFGAFIEIEDGIDGLVHVSNMSWTKRIKHPSEVVKKGDKVKAVVLGIEAEHRRLSLGIKQLQPDVWESFFAQHRVNDVLHGKVLRMAQFGAFVELAEGVEGLCHISEAVDGNGIPVKLDVEQEHEFKIIKMNPEEKKIGLSLRAVGDEATRADVEAYKGPSSGGSPSSSSGSSSSQSSSSSSSSTTLGDLLNWKRSERE
ncbi:MAG: 30S ribosomal protein S1 [Acidobacteriaceae bacterium]